MTKLFFQMNYVVSKNMSNKKGALKPERLFSIIIIFNI